MERLAWWCARSNSLSFDELEAIGRGLDAAVVDCGSGSRLMHACMIDI
jgi:hypothetical protein